MIILYTSGKIITFELQNSHIPEWNHTHTQNVSDYNQNKLLCYLTYISILLELCGYLGAFNLVAQRL